MNGAALPVSIASRAANLWMAGARMRARLYEKGLLRQHRLRASVISIGNISWGGTGKTPFTIWLAGRLQARGLRVSILTRGYGRTSRERVKIHPPGASPEAAFKDGDEVQLYLRRLNLPIGLSAARYEAGKLLENTFPVDVHLLDDGFQHLALARNLDLVLVDASNPWGARPGWPILLREGVASLRRAHAVVLTRCELGTDSTSGCPDLESLKATLLRCNPDAQCFLARTKLLHFSDLRGGGSIPVEQMLARRPLAFCALGNPQSFFRMLAGAGIDVIAKEIFADHHWYRAQDLRRLAKLARERRADCLITTEKDAVNLPSATTLPLPLYWADIETVVEEDGRLLHWIWDRLHLPLELLMEERKPSGMKQPHLAGGV